MSANNKNGPKFLWFSKCSGHRCFWVHFWWSDNEIADYISQNLATHEGFMSWLTVRYWFSWLAQPKADHWHISVSSECRSVFHSWRTHDMDTLSVLVAICEGNLRDYSFVGNPSDTGGFLSQRASNAGLWCLLCWKPKQIVEQTLELPVSWDPMTLISCHCHDNYDLCRGYGSSGSQWVTLIYNCMNIYIYMYIYMVYM